MIISERKENSTEVILNQKYQVNAPILSWDFPMMNEKEEVIMSVNKGIYIYYDVWK